MNNNLPDTKEIITKALNVVLTPEEQARANDYIMKFLQKTMNDCKDQLGGLRIKLSVTYYIIVVLSVIMFFTGIVLLSIPAIAGFTGQSMTENSIIAGSFGLADLVALFLSKPLERMHGIMGDMSQIILALNSFQTQSGLRLMEMNTTDRATIGFAADYISKAAESSIKLVQDYFEGKELTK